MDRNNRDTTTQTADVVRIKAAEATSDGRRGGPETPMNAADLKGKAVVSITTGTRLGRVDDVLFDRSSLTIAAFRVSADGQQALIPFGQVQSVGSDAVMVPDDDVAQWIATSSAADGLVSIDGLKRLKVVDDAGTLLGSPRAVKVDSRDGQLLQLQVHKGGTIGIGGETVTVPGGNLTSVGDDVIVVRTAISRI